MLFERMSWEENLALGGYNSDSTTLDLRAIADNALRTARDLGFELPPAGAIVADRSISERVRLEILRALSFDPRVLILDEPTSVLAPAALAQFLEMLRRLRDAGRAVIIVTHKLGEALAIADRITMLRRGRKIAELKVGDTNEKELAALMIGELPATRSTTRGSVQTETPTLTIEDLALERGGRRVLDNIALEVYPGEIVGIAGVDGNGQAELVATLAGALKPTAGRITLRGGGTMAVIPQNRDFDGLILDMPLWENLLLIEPLRKQFTRIGGILSRRRAGAFCRSLLERFAIRAAGAESPAISLSGGNRQRLTIARALATDPAALVAHDIARGLDLRAAAEVHNRLCDFTNGGGAVLLISTDLEEILELCSRSYVISRGRLREVANTDREAAQIGLMIAGARG